jgi:hypothetical protein
MILLLSPIPTTKQVFETQPWCIHWTLGPCVDTEIIQEPSKDTSTKWSYHRDPEIIPSCAPNLMSIPYDVGHKTRAEISSDVDCIAGFPSVTRLEQFEGVKEGNSNPKHAPSPNIKKSNASGNSCPAPLFPIAPGFESSFSAKITNIKMVLAMNSLKNWLVFVRKA